MKTLAKIIGYGLVLLLIVAALGFTYKYTNGFNEDLKTFYVEYGGKQILTADSKLTLAEGETHTFTVKYTFDSEKSEPKDYKVKIVPNVTSDFDYTVSGEKYLFSKTGELTSAFGLVKEQTQFSITPGEGFNLQKAIKSVNGGKTVVIPSDAEKNNPYPYRLTISSYNDKVVYRIDLKIVTDGKTDNDTGNSGGNTQTPVISDVPDVPREPTKQSYAISWRIDGNENNLLMADVICPQTAVAGETVDIIVSLIGDYKSQVTDITVFSGGVVYKTVAVSDENNSGNYYGTFSFTMPKGNAEIVVTMKEIVVSEYRNISYDTLGSGSYDSVNVYCADVAKPGEYVMASIYLAWDVEGELEIMRVVLENADTGDEICELERFNEFYDFTMPDCDVVILIYLMPV